MDKNKKIIIGVVVAISIIAVIGIICIVTVLGYIGYIGFIFSGYPYEKVLESASPEGNYTIEIIQKDARGFFGPSDVVIQAKNNNKIFFEKSKYRTQIFDDGGKGTVKINWKNANTAIVTLKRV